ncbi:MAG: hypothetical protein HRT45_19725 [Bdellovibrionales bacterium]|nr:hypothetical protein [Bdellovibrionales bacterium]
MKTMKILLIAGLIFVHNQSLQGQEQYSGVVIPQFQHSESAKPKKTRKKVSKTKLPKAQQQDLSAEVELLRMVSPDGNEVIFSLSETVMGRSLNHRDYKINGVNQKSHSPLCQKTITPAQELERAELKLELELIIDELKSSENPRFLTGTQRHILSQVPLCEEFQLQLTAINKMIEGYAYSELALTNVD